MNRRVIFPPAEYWTTPKGTNDMIDDNSYPPEWNAAPPPDPMDPRFGTVLEPIRPTDAERALVADLIHQYVSRDYDFGETFKHFWGDRHADHRWPMVFLAALEAYATTAVGSQGEQLTIARAADDRDKARETIADFGSQT